MRGISPPQIGQTRACHCFVFFFPLVFLCVPREKRCNSTNLFTAGGRKKELSLDKDSHIYVTKLGKIIVIKRVDEISLDEISTILQSLAKEKGITRNFLVKEVERAKEKLLEERHAKTQA